jgi:phospholipid/cholesterol/gamma-HCH transport system permease protein
MPQAENNDLQRRAGGIFAAAVSKVPPGSEPVRTLDGSSTTGHARLPVAPSPAAIINGPTNGAPRKLAPKPSPRPPADRVVWAQTLTLSPYAKPVRAIGDLFAMALDAMLLIFKPPFAWREYLLQSWFVARVSMVPALMMTLPYSVILTFIFNILLTEIGAGDFSGTGAAIGTVNQIAPIVTVLVVSGAGSTAMCADLGARTIREELDAMRVLGINPIQRLVVPRVLAATTVALALESAVTVVGLTGAFFFTVYVQHVSAGAFVAGLTTLTGLSDVVVSMIKATLFGYAAGVIACYKGISVGGGPAGVGNAVNETVVFTFMVLFAINVIVTAVGVQFTVT